MISVFPMEKLSHGVRCMVNEWHTNASRLSKQVPVFLDGFVLTFLHPFLKYNEGPSDRVTLPIY